MHKSFFLKTTLIASVIMAANSQAFELDKHPVTASATITMPSSSAAVGTKKQVMLMNIKLTAKEKQKILSNLSKKITLENLTRSDLPSTIDLGMNNVPVLDQGMHGSCVTFASTAIMDAVIGKGDYISQLCNLELGSYFEKNGYMPSGWEGAFGPLILDQMMRFGYVSQENQKTKSCAGVVNYPTNDQDNQGNPMTLRQFKNLSENYLDENGNENWAWVPLMNAFDRFDSNYDVEDAKRTLIGIKKSLANGQRLTFGTFLLTSEDCNDIACATYHAKNDTWAMTDSIKSHPMFIGGHEMVITGYDDNAVAIDKDGMKHQGLLILRNSWGENVGDHGNYYMSYDYFIDMAIEVQKIIAYYL